VAIYLLSDPHKTKARYQIHCFPYFLTLKWTLFLKFFLYTLLTSAIGRMILHKDGVAIARRFAFIAGVTYILRGLTLIATSFPAPSTTCQTSTASWRRSVFRVDEACGDIMGHAVNVVLAALAWCQYTQYLIIKILAWLTSIAAMVLFIVDRSHYSIDVLVSLFISVFCWKYYHMVMRLPTNNQNRLVAWMENSSGATAVEDTLEREPPIEGISLTTVVNEALGAPGPSKYKELREEGVA